MSGRSEGSPHRAFNGEVKTGVFQHNHRILAAEFKRAVLETLGCGNTHGAAHFSRTGERDGAHVRMFGQRRAYAGAKATDDIDYALRHACIGKRAHQVEGRHRSVLGGLDHTRIPANNGRQQFPGGNRHGEVPGRDHAANADRLTDGHRELVGQFRRSSGTEEAPALASHVISSVDGFLHVAASFFEHLAHLAGHVAGVFFLALQQHLGCAEYDFSSARSRDQAPLGESSVRGGNGGVHVGFCGLLENRHDFPCVGRITVFKGFAGRGLHPLSVNEVLENTGPCVLLAQHRCAGHGIGSHNASWNYA